MATLHEKKATQLFLEGYNCAQAVFAAFSDLTGLDEKTALRISSSFGGGIGRLREMCGTVSGMLMAAGMLYGYDDASVRTAKAELYSRVQELANTFATENGSYICRDLLGLRAGQRDDPTKPSPRDEHFMRTRPCLGLVGASARILDEYMETHPPIHCRNKFGQM